MEQTAAFSASAMDTGASLAWANVTRAAVGRRVNMRCSSYLCCSCKPSSAQQLLDRVGQPTPLTAATSPNLVRQNTASPKEQLSVLRGNLKVGTQKYEVLDSYNYSNSTQANHAASGTAAEGAHHRGPFAAIRSTLDVAYHGVYSPERQHLQDQLVAGMLASAPAQSKPWLIYTAGPMGAGKSHVVQWMFTHGLFLVDRLVHCDPDLLRSALPEWPGYVAHDPLTAGALTHREAGLLVELATEAALRANAHCWVDGSLRDGEWYRGAISDIRRRYPHYSIAILEVCAESEAIFERVARRAQATGRDVPREEVLDSIGRVPRSVAALCDLCDFSVKIDNSQSAPRLLKYCDADCCYMAKAADEDLSMGWEELRKRFGLTPSATNGRARPSPSDEVTSSLALRAYLKDRNRVVRIAPTNV
jgi:hypothetical protein